MRHIEQLYLYAGGFCVISIIFLVLTWERFVIPQFQYMGKLKNHEEISLEKKTVYIYNLIILLIFLVIVLSFVVFSLAFSKFTGIRYLGDIWIVLVGFLIFELGKIMPKK